MIFEDDSIDAVATWGALGNFNLCMCFTDNNRQCQQTSGHAGLKGRQNEIQTCETLDCWHMVVMSEKVSSPIPRQSAICSCSTPKMCTT